MPKGGSFVLTRTYKEITKLVPVRSEFYYSFFSFEKEDKTVSPDKFIQSFYRVKSKIDTIFSSGHYLSIMGP